MSASNTSEYITILTPHIFTRFVAEADELDKFLIFTTGADRPPPMGFQPKCTITFGHPEVTDYTTPYPKANTCTNTIRLPVLPSYAAFKTNVMAAIQNVTFFCDH